MGWGGSGSRSRKQAAPERALDEVERFTLREVATRLDQMSASHWRVDGDRVRGPGRTAVLLGDNHTGSEAHVDLVLVLDDGRADVTLIPDCVTGFGADREAKIQRAIEMWARTTGAALLETLERRGWHAERFTPDHPKGFPGRHAAVSSVVGWGNGPQHDAVQRWSTSTALLPVIAPALLADGLLDEGLVGIKFFLYSQNGTPTVEVRVNGQEHAGATAALLTSDWPCLPEGTSYVRAFALLEPVR